MARIMSVEERSNEPENAELERKAKRHTTIMRIVAALFGVLAIVSITLGVLNATIWQPSRTVTAEATVSGSRYIVTDPDVLGLVDDDVNVKVEAKGADEICMAIASSKDAAGWLSGFKYTRLTGLDDWTTLSAVKQSAHGQQQTGPDDVAFKDSDMWRSVTCGATVKAKVRTSAVTDVALFDLGEDAKSADVTFTWTRTTLPDFSMPWYVGGGVLAVVGVLCATILAVPPHKRRRRVVESTPVGEEVTIGEALAGSLNSIKPSFAPKGGRRRRHAAGADGQSQPVVVDPSARNLVADAAETGASVGEETSVISPDELQAYFARLAQEVGAPDDGDASVPSAEEISAASDGTPNGDASVDQVSEDLGDAFVADDAQTPDGEAAADVFGEVTEAAAQDVSDETDDADDDATSDEPEDETDDAADDATSDEPADEDDGAADNEALERDAEETGADPEDVDEPSDETAHEATEEAGNETLDGEDDEPAEREGER